MSPKRVYSVSLSLAFAVLAAMTGCSGNGGTPVAGIIAHAEPVPSVSPSATAIATATGMATASATATASTGPSASASPVPSAKATASPSAAASATPVPTPVASPTPVATATPTPVPTATPTAIANCATPLPAGNLFYVVTNNAATIDLGVGGFSGTSTQGFGIVQNMGASGTGLHDPSAVALNPANGNVYITTFATGGVAASVEEYPPNFGCTGPLAVLTGSNTVFGNSSGIAVDSAGYVYVADEIARTISLYAPLALGQNNVAPVSTLTLPAQAPNPPGADEVSIAIDAAGLIYVTSEYENEILVYPARIGSSLASTPVATIAGSATRLNNIVGVALDPSGRIYTATTNSPGLTNTPSILVFNASPIGTLNEAPVAQIVGSQTTLKYPDGIALDRSGVIYIVDAGITGVLEFPANPNGTFNEAPMGSVTGTIGSATLYEPYAIAAH